MILTTIFGFIFGIFVGSLFTVTWSLLVATVLIAGMCFGYSYFVSDKFCTLAVLGALFFLGMTCGMARVFVSNLYTHSTLDQFAGKTISAQGIVVDEPDVREKNTQLTIELQSIRLSSTTPAVTVHEKILVSVPLYPEFSYGDLVNVKTTLAVPDNISADDGRVFDYVNYLRTRGIWYVGKFPKVYFVSAHHGNVLYATLFKIKNAFTEKLNRALPAPESSLMVGLLIGAKQALGKELLSEFARAGVSHVVVLSGYNIAIIAESIMALLGFLPGLAAFLIGGISILLFTILSGGGASAVRAAIMVLVALFAKKTERVYSADRAFGVAVVVMLLFNPLLLVFDPSFQLSVLATIGLIFVSPFVAPYLKKVTEKYGMREIVSSTIATQIVVLPFLIYNTGILSLVSLPVNILILGTVPLTMLLGFITGIVGFLSLYLSFIPALFSYVLLWYQLTIVHIGATLPFGAINLPAFSFGVLVIVYILIFSVLHFLKNKRGHQ